MNRPPERLSSQVRDADTSRPALWRWVAFWFLVLLTVSLWVPVAHAPPTRPGKGFLDAHPVYLLLALAALAALVLPATLRVRILVAGLLLGSTLAAWALDEPIRRFLGAA